MAIVGAATILKDVRIGSPASPYSNGQNFVEFFAQSAGTMLKNNHRDCNLSNRFSPRMLLKPGNYPTPVRVTSIGGVGG